MTPCEHLNMTLDFVYKSLALAPVTCPRCGEVESVGLCSACEAAEAAGEEEAK